MLREVVYFMKKNVKFWIFTVCTIILLILSYIFELIGFAGITIISLILPWMINKARLSREDLKDNQSWQSSQTKLEREQSIKPTDKIRISFAYLFRIEVEGKYFLVKNDRGTKKYQPVGGVYKFNNDERQYLAQKYYIDSDHSIPNDRHSKNDYRLRLQNKHLRDFVNRFDNTLHREHIEDLGREFKEELFDTGILDENIFGTLTYTYCGRHIKEITYSNHFQCYELLLADIVSVELTSEQEDQFLDLIENGKDKCYFATSDEINSLGITGNNLEETIADHTIKILPEVEEYLIFPEKYQDETNRKFSIEFS